MRAERARVGVAIHMVEDQPFGQQFKDDLEAAVDESRRDVALEIVDSHGDARHQVEALESFLRRRVNALVLMAVDPESVKPSLRRFRDAGIPVIVVDNDLGDPSLYRSVLLPDNLLFGRKLGEFFVEASGGQATLVEIGGAPGSFAATLRAKGIREALAASPGIRIVDTLVGGWLHARAREEFAAWWPKHPEIDGVLAYNDEMARAAWEVAHGLGREDELLITGVDAIKGQGLSLVMQGKLAATLMNPSAGRPTAGQLLAVLDGEPVLERTLLRTSLFRSNERIRAWQERRERRRARA